jgi:hypothetical protein
MQERDIKVGNGMVCRWTFFMASQKTCAKLFTSIGYTCWRIMIFKLETDTNWRIHSYAELQMGLNCSESLVFPCIDFWLMLLSNKG